MKITVITATYNAASTISDCLASVARQTHRHIEHWVIDGGSTDGTQTVVERYREKLSGFVSEPDRGIYDALNKGVIRSSGDVIGFLHSDDVYASDEVLAKIDAAFADPAVEAVYGDLVYVDKHDLSRVIRYWKAGQYDRSRLKRGWMPPHPTFYVRRSVYERLGLFDTTYRIAADYDSVVRFLFTNGIEASYIPEVLVCMRIGGISNGSVKSVALKMAEDLRVIRAHKLGGLPALAMKNLSKAGQLWRRSA